MISRSTSRSLRTATSAMLALGFALGAGSCADGDAGEPDTTVVDELDPDAPFDPDVPGGVGTDTNEGDNRGFDVDERGPVGNQTSPND